VPVPSRSAVLLGEMAKAYGAADQIENPSELDALVFRSFQVEVVYRPARDMFSLSGKLGDDAPRMHRPARAVPADPKLVQLRKLRLFRPTGDIDILRGEVMVADLTFPEFSGALDDFLDAVQQARAGETISEDKFAPLDLPYDDLIWIKT
jgi:hypothetical protein